MKNNIIFLLGLLMLSFSACDKDNFEEVETIVETEEPTEESAILQVKTTDLDDAPIMATKVSVYNDGEKIGEELTDLNGELSLDLTVYNIEQSTLFILAQNDDFEEKAARIQLSNGTVGPQVMKMTPAGASPFSPSGSMENMLLSDEVVLIDGVVNINDDNPGGYFIVVFEEAALNENDDAYFASTGIDATGAFEFLVPSNLDLYITIIRFNSCSASSISTINAEDLLIESIFGLYAENIGSFTEDTTLEDYNAPNDENLISINVIGTSLDCEGNILPNATVWVSSPGATAVTAQSDAAGNFSLDYTLCFNNSGTLTVVVRDESGTDVFSSDEVSLDFDGQTTLLDFGQIGISCDPIPTNSLVFTDEAGNTYSSTNFNLLSYQEDQGLIIFANDSAPNAVTLALLNDNGQWRGQTFYFKADPQETDNLFFLTEGEIYNAELVAQQNALEITLIDIPVTIGSGPNAGQTDILNGTLIIAL